MTAEEKAYIDEDIQALLNLWFANIITCREYKRIFKRMEKINKKKNKKGGKR